MSSIPHSDNTTVYDIESDTNEPQRIITSNDPSAFMITSPDSPPFGSHGEKYEQEPSEKKEF